MHCVHSRVKVNKLHPNLGSKIPRTVPRILPLQTEHHKRHSHSDRFSKHHNTRLFDSNNMQIFLPFACFLMSLRALDNKRLGKQRLEGTENFHSLSKYALYTHCRGARISC
jgi:hypothetical protein